MIYEHACDECRIVFDVSRSVDMAGIPEQCPVCGETARRVFHAPSLLGRQKPGSYKFDKSNPNGWDSRLAGLRKFEERGSAGLREARTLFGKAYDMTLNYKKERYG